MSHAIHQVDRQVRRGPDDADIGNVRPDEAPGLGPDDAGIGNVRPDEAPGLGPDDAGIGNAQARESTRDRVDGGTALSVGMTPIPRDRLWTAEGEGSPRTTSGRDQDQLGIDAYLLLEELARAIEMREAADQDSPPWVAEREIQRLEHRATELVRVSLSWPCHRVEALELPDESGARPGAHGLVDQVEIQ